MERTDFKERTVLKTPYIGGEPIKGTLVETIYRPDKAETMFAIWNGTSVRYEKSFPARDNEALVPYHASNSLVRNRILLLPSAAEEYGTKDSLVADIRRFIHRYVSMGGLFETISANYVLLTWLYDSFGTIPYLRVRGDFGSGKTRFLSVIGSLCFRSIFASGASTVSPLFHLTHAIKGSLVIDEADFRNSDMSSALTKILNNGNSKGFPVLRSEQVGKGKEFNPVAFDVFGPKIIATRGYYQDAALESRMISEDMGRNRPRADIPLHLPESFSLEAELLRNKLLMFRFKNLKRNAITQVTEGQLEPRINQIFAPLLSLIDNDSERSDIMDLIREYSHELSLDRSAHIEGHIIEVIKELWTGEALPLRAITDKLNEKYRADFQESVTGKRVGFSVRKLLNIRTRKRGGVFEILPTEQDRLALLFRRFGLEEAGASP